MLDPEEALVVQRVAEANSEIAPGSVLEFESALCDGILTCKGSASVGAFAGTVFHAYLGKVKGEPWTYDFMLIEGGQREADFPTEVPFTITKVTKAGLKHTKVDRSSVPQPKVRQHRKH